MTGDQGNDDDDDDERRRNYALRKVVETFMDDRIATGKPLVNRDAGQHSRRTALRTSRRDYAGATTSDNNYDDSCDRRPNETEEETELRLSRASKVKANCCLIVEHELTHFNISSIKEPAEHPQQPESCTAHLI